MGTGYGMLGHVGHMFQNSFGTLMTNSLHYIPITNETLNLGIEQKEDPGMRGRMASNPVYTGFQKVEGGVTMMANPIDIGFPLKSVIGLSSTTSSEPVSGSGIYTQTHVFRPRTQDKDDWSATDLLTFEVNRDVGSSGIYYDCAGNTLAITINNGELMQFELGVIGAGFSKKAPSNPIYAEATPFKWDQVSASFNSAAIEDILELSINFNNNLEAKYSLVNSRAPTRIKRTQQPVIELSGTMLFTQHSYWVAFENQLELPLSLHFVGAETPNELTLFFPKIRFTQYTQNIGGMGLIEASFSARTIYDVTSGYEFQATLVNTQTYY